ncbi:hypothetical protein CHS0354_019797 [Potamilus streckersoni]|uniref:CCHC-type domain-containing protein n=1 Tax=Potamilus streckersoni TaxID=2493646 RepID=A0AAE0W277_9BIVA|nr:hypothetical protein CHS0354_019797 [Potamilus streckersoni]
MTESTKTSGVRVVSLTMDDVKKIPPFFYIMEFIIKSWYKGCENHSLCNRCGATGHFLRECQYQAKARIKNYFPTSLKVTEHGRLLLVNRMPAFRPHKSRNTTSGGNYAVSSIKTSQTKRYQRATERW